jgi:hypothetical protein
VLRKARKSLKGEFSILEFGTAHGYAFTKMLYPTRFLGMEDRVRVHAFDTFEGMPESHDPRDRDHVSGESWKPGQFSGRYAELEAYCWSRCRNHEIHKGLFEDTLTPQLLESLRRWKPLLVWVDCDFYTSTRSAMERLLPFLPRGLARCYRFVRMGSDLQYERIDGGRSTDTVRPRTNDSALP